jgi:hypothetical protein
LLAGNSLITIKIKDKIYRGFYFLTSVFSSKNLKMNFKILQLLLPPKLYSDRAQFEIRSGRSRFLPGYIQIANNQLFYHSRLNPIVRLATCGQHHRHEQINGAQPYSVQLGSGDVGSGTYF